MCWSALVKVLRLEIGIFNAKAGKCRNHERSCSKTNFLICEFSVASFVLIEIKKFAKNGSSS